MMALSAALRVTVLAVSSILATAAEYAITTAEFFVKMQLVDALASVAVMSVENCTMERRSPCSTEDTVRSTPRGVTPHVWPGLSIMRSKSPARISM